MAKTVTRKAAKRRGPRATGSTRKPTPKPAQRRVSKPRAKKQEQGFDSAAEALTGLLESPLVADVLAAGAAAGLAVMAQQAFGSRKQGSKTMLKEAAAAAAAAMAARLVSELDEILQPAKSANGAEA